MQENESIPIAEAQMQNRRKTWKRTEKNTIYMIYYIQIVHEKMEMNGV